MQSEIGTSTVFWNSVNKIVEYDNDFLITRMENQSFPLPKSFFSGADSIDAFKHLVIFKIDQKAEFPDKK